MNLSSGGKRVNKYINYTVCYKIISAFEKNEVGKKRDGELCFEIGWSGKYLQTIQAD